MFDFFKRKNSGPRIEVLPVTTDIHSHILPGIDDGAPDISTALDLVKGIYALGIRKTVATPHIIGDLYRNTPFTINAALRQLKAACTEEKIDITITAAAEYMLDDHFLSLLRDDTPLLSIHKNIILTEQSFVSPTDNLHHIAFEIITKGYRPIMAHPERYHFYHQNLESYSSLKDMGFLLQVNLLSLTGYYGKPVAKAARYLFAKGLVDLVGTDMHHERHLQMLQHPKSLQIFNEIAGDQKFNELENL
jgi:tyrosine-protein phosphatase YwqE